MEHAISATRSLSIKSKTTKEFDDILMQCGIIDFVYFIVKQPPLQVKVLSWVSIQMDRKF